MVNAANGGQNRQMGGQQGGYNQGGMQGMGAPQMGQMPQQMQMPQSGMNQPMNPGMNQAAMGAAGGNFMGGGF